MVKPIRLDEQLCFSIYKAQKEFNHFYSKALKPYHLTYPQYITLLALWEHGQMAVKTLGDFLELDSGTLTPLLKRLEKDDWITRTRSTKDERSVDVALTDKAVKLRDVIFAHVGDCMDHLDLTAQRYSLIRESMDEVEDHLAKIPNKIFE